MMIPFPLLAVIPPNRPGIPMGRRYVTRAVIRHWLASGWHRPDGVRQHYASVRLRSVPGEAAVTMWPRDA